MIERHADSFVVASLVVLLILGRPSGILARLETDPLLMIHLRLIFEFSCRRRSRSLCRRTSFRFRLRGSYRRLTQPNTTRNGALWSFFFLLFSSSPPLSFDSQGPFLSLSLHCSSTNNEREREIGSSSIGHMKRRPAKESQRRRTTMCSAPIIKITCRTQVGQGSRYRAVSAAQSGRDTICILSRFKTRQY